MACFDYHLVYIIAKLGTFNTEKEQNINLNIELVNYLSYIGTMNTDNSTKINHLLNSQPRGTVFLTSWLKDKGYSLDLLKRYRKTDWLTSIGTGAMIRTGENVTYEGALYSLQNQTDLEVHIGGKSALALLGKSHYLNLSQEKLFLFGSKGQKLPTWFIDYNWGVQLIYKASSFLPPKIGTKEMPLSSFSVQISNTARALMECLYLASNKQDILECYEVMEGLNNLRPNHVQELLENCNSIKVKRLFLYLAEQTQHQWLEHLNPEKVDLGSGKRSLVKDGVYNPKYKMTVPKETEKHGESSL